MQNTLLLLCMLLYTTYYVFYIYLYYRQGAWITLTLAEQPPKMGSCLNRQALAPSPWAFRNLSEGSNGDMYVGLDYKYLRERRGITRLLWCGAQAVNCGALSRRGKLVIFNVTYIVCVFCLLVWTKRGKLWRTEFWVMLMDIAINVHVTAYKKKKKVHSVKIG